MVQLASANDPQEELKVYALQKLHSVVDIFWPEISEQITKIEVLYEDSSFKQRKLAALLTSQVYYHLGELQDSLTFALGAGDLFNLESHTEYTKTIIAKGIEEYITLKTSKAKIDPRLETIVQKMFDRCFQDKLFEQAIGIALESYRLDIIEAAIVKGNSAELLKYVFAANMDVVQHLEFRDQVYRLLVKLHQGLPEPDYLAISQALMHLNDYNTLATILKDILAKDLKLIAYQIAFDLEENATQEFLIHLLQKLDPTPAFDNVRHILKGELSVKLYLEFLYKNNHADLLILKNTKNAFDSRSSAYHSAVTFANAFMHAGTTCDTFLRENLEWLSRASNWVKFSATSALGVIHKGQIAQSMQILSPYLPQEGVSGSPFSEGGSLFALGLIHANHGLSVLPYLSDQLKNARNETVQHGAALGLGVAGMATGDEDIFEKLKNVLYSDSAVAGEAAGIAMGLLMLGKASDKAIEEMLQYAHDTQHEKIIRGIALGLSFIMFGKEEAADGFVERLLADKDPILRYGGAYAVALAYAGTGNNKAIKTLLHIAVSDTSDDVRRAAVTGLGFLLFKTPQHVPRIVQLLAESYNPHVRYGATLALGISCAGTALQEAIDMLMPMTKDSVDYVRQGALIALALILVQTNDTNCPKVAEVRKLYETVIADKHEETMARFGAAIAQGIIDAGGRNCSISLKSANGNSNISAIVGMALFTQFWFWYPLTHFLCLAFTPTALIGLDQDLNIPKFEVVSNAKPSLFAYPPALKPPTTQVVEKVATAVLSTTAKAKARAKKQEKTEEAPMETDEKKEEVPAPEEKKEEPLFEDISNFSRVVPSQAQVISFKPDSRFVPIRKGPLNGIIMLSDKKPGEAKELIQMSVPVLEKKTEAPEPNPPAPFHYTE